MNKKTRKFPISVQRTLAKLGENIRVARIQRKMTVADLAERMQVSERTVLAIEAGKPGVAVGNVAGALLVLQELSQLGSILDMSSKDPIGDTIRKEQLPKRVRKKKSIVQKDDPGAELDEDGYLTL
ncbi:helix-turn-helix transcriptional regulator [Kordiimonas sp.]|uniref:helix-turn-helix transcriptional regulator n=1 Tax=Kordiimonas sp. TaxID=1970157 RepID=UPI003B527193